MLSGLFKFILAFSLLITTVLFLLLFSVYFFFLNEKFYYDSFSKYGIYKKVTETVKQSAKESINNNFNENNKDYVNMTSPERSVLNTQVDSYLSFINENMVTDLINTNLKNFSDYLKNKSTTLILYFPITNWGLPEKVISQIPDYLKNTNINAEDLLSVADRESSISTIRSLRFTSRYTLYGLLTSVALSLILFLIYLMMQQKNKRGQAIGKLLSIHGLIILILAWSSHTLVNFVIVGSVNNSEPSLSLIILLLQILLKPIVVIFSVYGIIALISGIFIFNKGSNQELVTKAKLR
jgi:hypothetical protein